MRCSKRILSRGSNFPKIVQCKRDATTKDGEGNHVCTQHAPAAIQKRQEHRDKCDQRRQNAYHAWLRARSEQQKKGKAL